MSAGASDNPYQVTSVVPPGAQLPTEDSARSYRIFGIIEIALGCMLLLVATLALGFTVAFLIWAVGEGDVPLLGMFMAGSMRFGVALTFGVPGLLFVMAGRTALQAGKRMEVASTKRMRNAHWVLLIGILAMALLCLGAIVLFAIALAASNM